MAIEKLKPEDLERLQLVPVGKKHVVRQMLLQMKPGEVLRIGREDFKWKGKTPSIIIRALEKTKRWKFRIWNEQGANGWVVERVK